ncbi:MAG TPA: ABC transporter permease [Candidatus Cybelea sp.]|nr:ABC transporter permease [Candidatus Cybelea sp.]
MQWWQRLVDKSRAEHQLDRELCFHIERQIADYLAAGIAPDEARRRARREFGGLDQVREQCHEAQRGHLIETIVQDTHYGLRMLRKTPGFTAVVVLTLALGIGANTAIFSLVDGILLRALPFPHADRLVGVAAGTYPKGAFAEMRKRMQTMDVGAYSEGYELNLSGLGDPVRLNGTVVSAELFSVLGAVPEMGRTFSPGEDMSGRNRFVILSYSLWQRRFGGDPNILGHSIDLEGVDREIVGVMPAAFRFPSSKTDIWIPLDMDPRNQARYWAGDFMPVVGRLHPGATVAQARAEIRVFQAYAMTLFPWPMEPTWNKDVSVEPLETSIVGDFRDRLLLLLAAVTLVLLIACANVANLTLSRASTRRKEIALRTSLGASRGRILRQLLTESTVLASLGGILGLLFAWSGLSAIRAALPTDTPRLAEAGIDWRVLVFTGALTILTGLISGLLPAFESSRTEPAESLKSTGRSSATALSRRWRKGLVSVELALAVLLVSGAGLLLRSLWALSHMNPGFGPEHIVTARITPNESFCNDRGRCDQFYRNLLERVRGIPGVSDAATVNTLPLDGRVNKRSQHVEGRVPAPGEPDPLFWQNVVSPDYFRLMRIPVLRGRDFTNADGAGRPPVVILSESTARRFWPNGDALGKHLQPDGDQEWFTIVGIVADVRAYSLLHAAPTWIDGTVYIPYGPSVTLEDGSMPAEMTLVVRTPGDVSEIGRAIRDVAFTLNPEAPVSELKTMPAVVREAMSAPRSAMYLFLAFAALALILGVVGIYGVISFFVGQRTPEIGIRMALGAQRSDILRMVVAEGLSLTVPGVAAGLGAALGLSRLLGSLLYGVSATDPLALAGVALLFSCVAVLACCVPARRALRVDPAFALHEE